MHLEQQVQRLGERLIKAGVLPPQVLEVALAAQRKGGGYLPDVLLALRLIPERELLAFLAADSKLHFISTEKLSKLTLDSDLLDRFPVRLAERLEVMPVRHTPHDEAWVVAIPDPQSISAQQEIRAAVGARRVDMVLAVRASIKAAIRRYYYRDAYAFAGLDGFGGPANPPVRVHRPQAPRDAPETTPVPRARTGDPQRELQLLRIANSLQRHLLGERNVLELIQRVLAFAFDNLPADEGLFLWRDGSGSFEPRAVRSRIGAPSEVRVSESLLREVLGTQKSVLTFDASRDKRFGSSETVAGARLRSAIGVPLIIDRQVTGAILLVTQTEAGTFQQTDLEVLEAIAAQTSLSIAVAELTRQITSESATRDRLARFMSPALVELVSTGKLAVGEAGVEQEVTILFADIRGFTTISERLQPAEVVAMLNEHFEALVELVFGASGTLDKFIGDALMAVWGAPVKRAGEEAKAVRCALAMVARVEEMNRARAATGRIPLPVGVGLNTGRVVFGAMGATRRMDLTVVGDAVNIAARLCDVAPPGAVVVSEETLRRCGDEFEVEALPTALLKGKQREVRTFRVIRDKKAR